MFFLRSVIKSPDQNQIILSSLSEFVFPLLYSVCTKMNVTYFVAHENVLLAASEFFPYVLDKALVFL